MHHFLHIFHVACVCSAGNGVVIHLPGLFEEAEKNMRKGKSEYEGAILF